MDLQSLNSIFERRILRIPDYQRGYAWNRGQLEDFWEDLLQLESERVHYTGVITLEPVAQEIWATWEHDQWLIKDVDYKPFYVVDGQQRLITSTIFIQAIIEKVLQSDLLTFQSLVFQSIEDIRKKFILYKAGDGIRKSYIFGYEKDNPSDEYLRTHIFGMYSHSNQQKKTLYTRNLLDAKKYFKEQLSKLELEEIGVLYKKVTQKFKFNLYEVSEEIDVFVAFEAMNNRGKPLTNLELLKNRLIYLSTLFKDNDGKEELRANINDAWKTMYEYLGKNHEAPLDDDEFLRNHWMMYFKYSRNKGDDYIKFLLNEKFNARNITHPKPDKDGLKIEEIYKYVKSLQQSIGHWFHIHNPCYEPSNELTSPQKLWLDRLNRLSFRSFKPLILSAFISRQDPVMLVKLLEAAERYIFTSFNLSRRRSNTGDSTFFSMSRALQAPAQDFPRMPVHDCDQIGKSPGHGQIRDIRTPHLVGTVDLQVSQQIRVDPMGLVGLAGFLTARVGGPAPHQSHQTLDPLAVDRQPMIIEQGITDPPGPVERQTKVNLVNPPHQRQFRFIRPLGAVIGAGAAD